MKTKGIIYSFVLTVVVGVFMSSCCENPKTEAGAVPVEAEVKYVAYPDDALKIVATASLKDSTFQADFEKALQAVVEGTNKEEGNIAYEAHQDINNPLVYVIIEVWKSQEAINFHNETDHFKAFVAAIGDKADLNVNTMKKLY